MSSPFNWRPRQATTRIIIHDSHTGPDTKNAVAHLRTNGRVNGLLDIGYHYVIDRDGGLTVARPVHVMGSHTPAHNHDSIGICLVAGDDHEPTDKQLHELARLCQDLMVVYRLSIKDILGHNEVVRYRNSKNNCPCFDMDELRQRLPEA